MQLSKTEIQILEQIAKGNRAINKIALALKKSIKQIYVTVKKLTEKGLIEPRKGLIKANKATHITLFLQILSKHPNLHPVLSDSGIPVLTALLQPLTIEEISAETGIKRSMVYKKLKEANKRSILIKTASKFRINEKIWRKLKEFLQELKKYEQTVSARIPASSIIYFRKKEKIVFSCKETFDAAKTAFSAYEKFGIKLMLTTNYYCLPKKKLTKNDILRHSLFIVEKELSIRNLIFLALFYAKYKKKFKVKHSILKNLRIVLAGKKVKEYPSYEEIKDRAELYGIIV